MRKLIVCNIVSLDRYYEGLGGDVMALPFDQGFDEYNAERLRAATRFCSAASRTKDSKATGHRSLTIPTFAPAERRSLASTTLSRRSSSPTA
jgi:hypothetical protein